MKFTAILLVDDVAGPFQWTRAQPPFSFLSLTAVEEILQLAPGPREGPLFYVWLSTAANAAQKKGPGGCSLKRPALTTALLGRHVSRAQS
jgi:hypothetical protein